MHEILNIIQGYQFRVMQRILDKLKSLLDYKMLKKWFIEAVTVNTLLFVLILPKKMNLPEWLPFFIAEHAVRPYIAKSSKGVR